MCNTISLLAVTNRHLSVHPYPEQIARICQTHPKGLILREKDLEAESYLALAAQVLDICHKYDVPCILHTFWKEAIALGCTSIHLPLPLLRRLSEKGILSSPEFTSFTVLGTSVHSVAEAREAEHLGVTYLTAGHIYVTDCKKDLHPVVCIFCRKCASLYPCRSTASVVLNLIRFNGKNCNRQVPPAVASCPA